MPHDLFHRASWRALRLGALVIGTPVALISVMAMALLWRLSSGPMDVTAIADRFGPVVVQPGLSQSRPAGRLVWKRVMLGWQPGLRHFHPELGVEAEGLQIIRQNGSAIVTLDHVALGLRMGPLWRGRIEPTRLALHGGRIVARRQQNGSIDLDWTDARHTGTGSLPLSLDRLKKIDLGHLSLMLHRAIPAMADGAQPQSLAVMLDAVQLDRPRMTGVLGWSGAIDGSLTAGSASPLSFHIQATTRSENVTWRVRFPAFMPDRFGAVLPYAGQWHLPVSAELSLTLPAGTPRRNMPGGDLLADRVTGWLGVSLGAGTIDQKDADALRVSEGHLAVPFRIERSRLSISGAEAAIGLKDDQARTTRFDARASLDADSLARARKISGTVSLASSTLDVGHLAAIWPRFLMKGARRWVTRNMTAGTGEGLRVTASLEGATGWSSVRPSHVDAALAVDHAVVHWLRPVPPARDVAALFSFASADSLAIKFLHGVQPSGDSPADGVIHLDGGSMLISDLYARDQTGTIGLDLSCDLGDCARLLAHPRLHLLSRHPLPFTHLSGNVTVHEVLSLPLSSHIENDQIHVNATARFRDVSLGNVVLGRDLVGASGSLAATEKKMSLTGEGELGGVSTQASFEENFLSRAGGVRETIHAVSLFDEAAFDRAHVSNNGLFQGQARLVTDYRAGFDGRADVRLALDMTDAALTIPVWHKDSSLPASASAHIGLRDGKIVALDAVSAQGPGLDVRGSGRIADGQVQAIVLDGFHVGRSRGDAVVELPASDTAPVTVQIHAQDLDVSGLLRPASASGSSGNPSIKTALPGKSSTGAGGAKDGGPSRSLDWRVDLATDRLFYGQEKYFGGVTAQVEHRRDRLERARITANYPVGIKVELTPHVDGRYLDLRIDNLGRFLHETGMTERLDGGTARVKGRVGDGGAGSLPPFQGVISVSPFTFRQPPAALTAATHLSVFNWSQASHDRFEVQHLHLPVRVGNDVMTIHEGHLGNPALGATLEGKIGLDKGTLDLRGTVVPVFGLNAAPGRLPNVGKLFSPEKGGGVLAATFTVKGDAGNPDLSVNPFAMLLPGVMRELAK